jgi:hypothetical protein
MAYSDFSLERVARDFGVKVRWGSVFESVGQLVAAELFNDRRNRKIRPMYGCVTTADLWQFLKLQDNELVLHDERLFLSGLDQVTWAIVTILKNGLAQVGAAA